MKITHALVALLLASGAPYAQAQQPPTALESAIKLYEEAEVHYRLQEWEKALEKYKEAYRLSQEPEMLFNIGQCYRMLKKYDEAIKSYKTFQREVPNSPQRDNVNALIASTENDKKQADLLAAELAANQSKGDPATQTVIIREVATTQPKLPEPAEGMDSATRLHIASVGSMAGSFLFGGLALSARIAKDSAAINEDADAFQSARGRTIGMSLASDALTVAAFGIGALSYKKSPRKRSAFALYGTSATAAILGVGCGAAAFSASKQAGESSDPIDSRIQDARAGALSNAADVSFITAALAGGLGVVIHLKTPSQEVVVAPTRGGISVGLSF
jgi:hypothetical protein